MLRYGVRALNESRLRRESRRSQQDIENFIETIRHAPIAPRPELANEQHYEVPAGFFEAVLGPRLKYSSCVWGEGVHDLAAAEEQMLALSVERAGLEDGMRLLDLGCGWGSLSLWVAEHFPRCEITCVSNSAPQAEFIRSRAARAGIGNLTAVTADINEFAPDGDFDRVMSIEMFEHARNWPALLERVEGWLAPNGRVFIHVFCHRHHAYPFADEGAGSWMARNFFSEGLMPSFDLIRRFDDHLTVEEQWRVDGTHYARTAEAWLENLDGRRLAAEAALGEVVRPADIPRALARWRMFFVACAETFAAKGGQEWFVGHYRLGRPREIA